MYTPPPAGDGPSRGPRWPLIGGIGCGGLLVLLVFFWTVGTIVGPPPEDPAEPAAAGTSSAAVPPVSPSVSASPARETPAAAPSTPASSPPAPPAAKPATPSAAPTPTRRTVPRPTAEQQHTYLARVRLIDPALAAKPERDIRRARGVCDRIINPPGGSITLVDYTIYMLSGPDVQLDERQARQVINAVRAWCR